MQNEPMKNSLYLRQPIMNYIVHPVKYFVGIIMQKIRIGFILAYGKIGEKHISCNQIFVFTFRRFHAFHLLFSIDRELFNFAKIISYLLSYVNIPYFCAKMYFRYHTWSEVQKLVVFIYNVSAWITMVRWQEKKHVIIA